MTPLISSQYTVYVFFGNNKHGVKHDQDRVSLLVRADQSQRPRVVRSEHAVSVRVLVEIKELSFSVLNSLYSIQSC